MDGKIRSIRKLKATSMIQKGETIANATHVLNTGDYVYAFHYLHHGDSKYFEDPETWRPSRFLVRSLDSDAVSYKVNQKTLRPYGAGISMCKGRVIAERVCLYAVASILHNWEIEPADANGWIVPGHISAAGVCKPDRDIRIVMSKRDGSA